MGFGGNNDNILAVLDGFALDNPDDITDTI